MTSGDITSRAIAGLRTVGNPASQLKRQYGFDSNGERIDRRGLQSLLRRTNAKFKSLQFSDASKPIC